MNKIDTVRAEIRECFDPQNFIEDSLETDLSPNNRYRLQTSEYRQTKPDLNWVVTKVEIYDNDSEERLFDFISVDRFFHAWLTTNSIEYVICAEDIFGGQTVIDLTNRRMESYSPDEDGFIWTEFSLSPSGKTLATVGCIWACPFEIRVYDFDNPMALPLPELKTIELIGSEKIVDWVNDKTFRTKGIQTEYKKEFSGDGSFTLRDVGEKLIERVIRIDE